MHLSGIDDVLSACSLVGQLLLILVLFARKLVPKFPFFTASFIYSLIGDPLLFWVLDHESRTIYFKSYFAVIVLDYLLQLFILVEITLNVVLRVRRSLPKGALVVFFCVLCAGAIGAYFLAPVQAGAEATGTLLKVSSVFALLRVGLFVAIAGFAQALGINWRSHVLQIASGLAFYSTISLGLQLSLAHLSASGGPKAFPNAFHALDQAQVLVLLVTIGYWIWAFSRNEAPRKEFTPQMQQVLVTIAGTARRTRLAVTRSTEK